MDDANYKVEKFPARPLEKWVHGLNFGELWMYDTARNSLWEAKLDPHNLYVESTSWYNEYGEEQSAGGYEKRSKRWRELTLWGPYSLCDITLSEKKRPKAEWGKHKYPGGIIGKIEPKKLS
ncbi:MAG: hypothetical protein OXC26_06295 [Albidovulum sp.]|nr:hypothetical protein [Albidovulum sp.]